MAHTNHGPSITPTLVSLFYQIGTRAVFDFGEYVSEQVLKQAKYFAIKLPIAFPSLISGILIKQKSDILTDDVVVRISSSPLNFSYKLFIGKNVSDNILPNLLNFGEADMSIDTNIPEVPLMSGDARGHILNVLVHEFKALQ